MLMKELERATTHLESQSASANNFYCSINYFIRVF